VIGINTVIQIRQIGEKLYFALAGNEQWTAEQLGIDEIPEASSRDEIQPIFPSIFSMVIGNERTRVPDA